MKLSDYLKWIAAVSGAPDPKSISQAETLESRVAELDEAMRPLLDFKNEANHEKWIAAKQHAAEILARK